MDLFSLTIGIAIGAAFSPFWMKVWTFIKAWAVNAMNKQPPKA